MLTTVTGECEPFSPAWLDLLDSMTKEEALAWVRKTLDTTVHHRNTYGAQLLNCRSQDYNGVLNAYVIDCNNVVRLTKLYRDIEAE